MTRLSLVVLVCGMPLIFVPSLGCAATGWRAATPAVCPKCGHSPCVCGGGGSPNQPSRPRQGGIGFGSGGIMFSIPIGGAQPNKGVRRADPPGTVFIDDGDRSANPKRPAAPRAQDDGCEELLKKVKAADQKYADAWKECDAANNAMDQAVRELRKKKISPKDGNRDKNTGEEALDHLQRRASELAEADSARERAAAAESAGDKERLNDAVKEHTKKAQECDEGLERLSQEDPSLRPLIVAYNKARARFVRAAAESGKAGEQFEALRKRYVKHCHAKYRGIVESKKKAEAKEGQDKAEGGLR